MRDLPCLVLFTKPAQAGRVKTRLIGAEVGDRRLDAADAARLHAALLGDLAERLAAGAGRHFHLRVAWDLEPGEEIPPPLDVLAGRPATDAVRQRGEDLGERMFRALEEVALRFAVVAVVGSDHPTLRLTSVRRGLETLSAGASDVALGPSEDGGYHFLAVRRERLERRLFEDVEWSSGRVLEQTRERCRELGARVVELPAIRDVDRAEDLAALAVELDRSPSNECLRTRQLLVGWGLSGRPGELQGALSAEEGRPCAS